MVFSGHCYENGLIHTISTKTPQSLCDFQGKLTLSLWHCQSPSGIHHRLENFVSAWKKVNPKIANIDNSISFDNSIKNICNLGLSSFETRTCQIRISVTMFWDIAPHVIFRSTNWHEIDHVLGNQVLFGAYYKTRPNCRPDGVSGQKLIRDPSKLVTRWKFPLKIFRDPSKLPDPMGDFLENYNPIFKVILLKWAGFLHPILSEMRSNLLWQKYKNT